MARPLRLTAVLTHPVQYVSPWFRHIAASCPELDLTVLYAALPTPAQQAVGFGTPFAWDVPLTDGYRFQVCADGAGKSFDSDRFLGLDVPRIGDRIRETRPDVVLIAGWHSAMQVRALRACRRLAIPVLYRGDSTLFSGPRGAVRPLWALKSRYMLRQFDGYLAVGACADEYLRTFGAPDPLITRSPHCVDNERFWSGAEALRTSGRRPAERAALHIEEDDFVVFFSGKFQPRKRPLDAVRAAARLGARTVLMTAGDGPLAEDAQAEARRLGVRLAWRGFLNQTEMPRALAISDAVLVPSAWESWGLAVNEALAAGVPCVVTNRVACAPDLIADAVTGFVVEPGDSEGMAVRLAEIRDAKRRGHEYATECRRRVATCSFERATEGLRVLARRVVDRRIGADARRAPVRVAACCGGMVSVFGVERISFEVLRTLRDHGASVHCLVNSWGSSRIVPLAEAIGATWSPGHYGEPVRRRGLTAGATLRLAVDVARTSAVLYRDARAMRATHLFVPDFVALLRNLPAVVALRLQGAQVIMKIGNAPDETPFYRRLWQWGVAPFADWLVANSRFTASALAAVGVPPRKIRVIRNAAPARNATSPSQSTDDRRVIYVGQLIPAKGPDVLLDAVAELRARGVPASLDVVGDIDGWESPAWAGYHARLRARAMQDDLSGAVRFLGQREDVPALLGASAVHCVPSRPELREAFGIVVVEAKTAGIPSVVTRSGGLPELIDHGRDGWICADATPAAIADGLEYFLSDDERRRQAGEAARRSAGQVSHANFQREWLEVFGLRESAGAGVAEPVERHAH